MSEKCRVCALLLSATVTMYAACAEANVDGTGKGSAQATAGSRADAGDKVTRLADRLKAQTAAGESKPALVTAQAIYEAVTGEFSADRRPFREALRIAGETFLAEGRYTEAELLYREMLARSRRGLGKDHPLALADALGLSAILEIQGATEERRMIEDEILDSIDVHLDKTQPTGLDDLDKLFGSLGTRDDVRAFAGHYALWRKNGRAWLSMRKSRYDEAEAVLRETLAASRRAYGDAHPMTTLTRLNLVELLVRVGRASETPTLYRAELAQSRAALLQARPEFLDGEIDRALRTAKTDGPGQAVALLRSIGPRTLGATAARLATVRRASVRRLVLDRRSRYQNAVLDLARRFPGEHTARLAADTVLRWKGLADDGDAYLAQLMRDAENPRAADSAAAVMKLRGELAATYHQSANLVASLNELDTAEAVLEQMDVGFRNALAAPNAGVTDIEGALPDGALLLEYRRYRSYDDDYYRFHGPAWFAAVLVSPFAPVQFVDIGPLRVVETLLDDLLGEDEDWAAEARVQLAKLLISPLAPALAEARRVYIAPDGILHMVPFEDLPYGGVDHWRSQQDVRIVNSAQLISH